MNDIRIYSVQNMVVRDGFITDGDELLPYYQKIDKKENNSNKYQSFLYKLKILFKVF
jgi:hypothetical protein